MRGLQIIALRSKLNVIRRISTKLALTMLIILNCSLIKTNVLISNRSVYVNQWNVECITFCSSHTKHASPSLFLSLPPSLSLTLSLSLPFILSPLSLTFSLSLHFSLFLILFISLFFHSLFLLIPPPSLSLPFCFSTSISFFLSCAKFLNKIFLYGIS